MSAVAEIVEARRARTTAHCEEKSIFATATRKTVVGGRDRNCTHAHAINAKVSLLG